MTFKTMYNTVMVKWVEQAVKSTYKHSLIFMTVSVDRSYITFTVAEERWVGRESNLAGIS